MFLIAGLIATRVMHHDRHLVTNHCLRRAEKTAEASPQPSAISTRNGNGHGTAFTHQHVKGHTFTHDNARFFLSVCCRCVCVCVLRLSKADAHVYSLRCLTKVHDRHFVSASIGDCPGDVGLTLETSQEISPRGPSVAAQTVSVTHQRQALNVALNST